MGIGSACLELDSDETGLVTATSHQGNGTEHRLFSATVLVSHEVVVNLITTRTGLRVQSQLDTNRYPAGRTVSDDELEAIICVETLSMVNGIIRCTPRCAAQLN